MIFTMSKNNPKPTPGIQPGDEGLITNDVPDVEGKPEEQLTELGSEESSIKDTRDGDRPFIKCAVSEDGTDIVIEDGERFDKSTFLDSCRQCLKVVKFPNKASRHQFLQKVCAAFGLPIEGVSNLDEHKDVIDAIEVLANERIPDDAKISQTSSISETDANISSGAQQRKRVDSFKQARAGSETDSVGESDDIGDEEGE